MQQVLVLVFWSCGTISPRYWVHGRKKVFPQNKLHFPLIREMITAGWNCRNPLSLVGLSPDKCHHISVMIRCQICALISSWLLWVDEMDRKQRRFHLQ